MSLVTFAILCGLLAVGALAVNYGLQTIYKSRMADYSTKRSLIDELDGRVRTLSGERLIKRPDDSVMLSQLFRVIPVCSYLSKEAQISGNQWAEL